MTSSQGYSLTFLRGWVIVGALAFVFMLFAAIFGESSLHSEWARFLSCQEKTRFDCAPTSMWSRYGWYLDDDSKATTAIGTKPVSDKQEETTRVTTSSDAAPVFVSMKAEGMMLSNHRYLAKPGAKVQVQAQVTKAKSVDLYMIQLDETGTPNSMKIGAMQKGSDDQYSLEFTIPEGLFGDLELRATGTAAGQTSSMFVHVGATTEAVTR